MTFCREWHIRQNNADCRNPKIDKVPGITHCIECDCELADDEHTYCNDCLAIVELKGKVQYPHFEK